MISHGSRVRVAIDNLAARKGVRRCMWARELYEELEAVDKAQDEIAAAEDLEREKQILP